MKIMNIGIIPQKSNNKIDTKHKCLLQQNPLNYSNKTPSFKMAEKDLYKKILTDKNLLAGLGAFVTGVYATLVSKAYPDASDITEDEKSTIINNYANIISQGVVEKNVVNNDNEDNELVEQIDTNELNQEIIEEDIENPDKTEEIIDENPLINLNDNEHFENDLDQNVYINFPEKIGKGGRKVRLTQNQEKLKMIIENISLPEASANKLIDICGEILQKGSYSINNEIKDNNDITVDLCTLLSDKSNELPALISIIDDYHKAICSDVKQQDSTDKKITSNNETVEHDDNFIPINVELKQPKIVGFKDLSTVNGRKRKEQINKTSIEEAKEKSVKEDAQKSFLFQLPGTIDQDLKSSLYRLIVAFRKEANPNREVVSWVRRPKLGYVHVQNIKNELDRINNSQGNHKPYQFINESNAAMVAKVINSDTRYQSWFTLHSAMRLIDRFVECDNPTSITQAELKRQSRQILDALTSTLRTAFKQGVNVGIQRDEADNIGAKIIVPSSYYDEQSRKVFGTIPLTVCFCENMQYAPYNNQERIGLISTIFPNMHN